MAFTVHTTFSLIYDVFGPRSISYSSHGSRFNRAVFLYAYSQLHYYFNDRSVYGSYDAINSKNLCLWQNVKDSLFTVGNVHFRKSNCRESGDGTGTAAEDEREIPTVQDAIRA